MRNLVLKSVASCVVVSAVMLSGCTTYYKVADPSTGKTYYTTEVREKGGSTQLVDVKTGSKVTIQNSEVSKISSDEFRAARYQK